MRSLILPFVLFISCSVSLRLVGAERIVLVAGGELDQVAIPAIKAKLYEPFGAEFDTVGNMWIIEMASGNRLLKVDSNGVLLHFAGKKHKATAGEKTAEPGDGNRGLDAAFNGPHNLVVPAAGPLYIADTWNGLIRTVDRESALVGSLHGYSVPAEKARSMGPYCVAQDPSQKRLYIADLNQVHAIDLQTGNRSIVAGNGKRGVPADGAAAIDSPLVDPRAVAVDRSGNVYILERGGNALRVVSSDGKIRTVVNQSGKKGISAPSGPAIAAMMNGPKHLCIDTLDRVLIADAENHVVIRYDPKTELVSRVAGTGTSGRTGIQGDPLSCQLARPHGVTVHPTTGAIYITDSYNDRILKIENITDQR